MSTRTTQSPKPRFLASVWLGIIGSALIWALHLQAAYALVTFVDRGHSKAWLYGTTMVCFVLVLICALFCWRDLRTIRDNPADEESSEPAGYGRFLAMVGLCGSALFALTILATGAAALFLNSSWK